MNLSELGKGGIVLLGCGKMGTALLSGWLERGLPSAAAVALDPFPSAWLEASEIQVNPESLPDKPVVCLIAVKPQMMHDALASVSGLGNGRTLFVSIAAGTRIAQLEEALGERTPIVRTMPNTPAAIGLGITAMTGNKMVGDRDLEIAEMLLSAVGDTIRVPDESQIDIVTAVSGSGPAYFFHLIEALAEAGEREGLDADLSLRLATATAAGAGALAHRSEANPAQLRKDVTSPGGTTAAALEFLMDESRGLRFLMQQAVAAAANRARELGKISGTD